MLSMSIITTIRRFNMHPEKLPLKMSKMTDVAKDEIVKLNAKIADLERCLGDLRRWSDCVLLYLPYITVYFVAICAKHA
jgi:hypothetical protein